MTACNSSPFICPSQKEGRSSIWFSNTPIYTLVGFYFLSLYIHSLQLLKIPYLSRVFTSLLYVTTVAHIGPTEACTPSSVCHLHPLFSHPSPGLFLLASGCIAYRTVSSLQGGTVLICLAVATFWTQCLAYYPPSVNTYSTEMLRIILFRKGLVYQWIQFMILNSTAFNLTVSFSSQLTFVVSPDREMESSTWLDVTVMINVLLTLLSPSLITTLKTMHLLLTVTPANASLPFVYDVLFLLGPKWIFISKGNLNYFVNQISRDLKTPAQSPIYNLKQ